MKFFYKPIFSFFAVLISLASFGQTALKMMTTGGPAGNGPLSTAQVVTLSDAGTGSAYSPTVTVTYTLSNQQYGAGTVEGLPSNSAMNFGGTLTASPTNSPITPFAFYSLMNGISSPTNAMFTACNSLTAGTGVTVTTDRSISLFNCTDALISSGSVNQVALNSRVYYGDLTISFNRPVSNPVLQFVGLGGTGSFTFAGINYDMGYATEFDLVGSAVTLNKLSGNAQLGVSTTQVTNTATWLGSSSVGTTSNGVTRYAASGSVVALGSNITSITLKVFVRGDGGRINNGTSVVAAGTANGNTINPTWSFGASNPWNFANFSSVSGDLMLFGVSFQKPVTLSGNVFNDPNGANVNNSTGTTNLVPSGMFANLTDANGKVVTSVAVNTDGTYSFPAIFEGNYTVNISTTSGTQGAAAPAVALPAAWVATGEFNGTPNTGSDGTVNGTSATFTVGTTDVTNINFGIERTPTSPNQSYTIGQPVQNSFRTLNGTGALASPGPLSGTDPDDGSLGSGSLFNIVVGAGMNGNKLFYNGVQITGAISIPNYNPALLQVQFTGNGANTLSFIYQSFDAAGTGSNFANYTINWLVPLAVQNLTAAVTLTNNVAIISWTTENEINTSRFYAERSTDNKIFIAFADMPAAGNNAGAKDYSIEDDIASLTGATVIYYRIKEVDGNGKITYSNIATARLTNSSSIQKVWPNPFVNEVNISLYSETKTTIQVRITDIAGKLVKVTAYPLVKGNNQVAVTSLNSLVKGIYILQISDVNGNTQYVQKITKD